MGLSLGKKALFLTIAYMPLLMVLADRGGVISKNVVPFAYGDMDNWIVREVHESGIIEGNTKWLYELGPLDTITGNTAFCSMGGSPRATPDVMAEVAGVVKTSTSALPEEWGDETCARIEAHYESVKVFDLVDIEVIVAGSVFLGTAHELIKGTRNPQAMLQSGVPSFKKPKVLRSDYKMKVAPEKNRVHSTGLSRKDTVTGQDSSTVTLLLQKRWESAEGNVYSKRVSTMVQRYTESTPDWMNDATYPTLYRNITSKPRYEPYMHIQVEEHYTLDSKGKSVPIQEVGRVEPGEAPTHTVLQFTLNHGGAYVGFPGSMFWIDNIKLIY